jgi:hypothetical protein
MEESTSQPRQEPDAGKQDVNNEVAWETATRSNSAGCMYAGSAVANMTLT